jgi:hypothetical protein
VWTPSREASITGYDYFSTYPAHRLTWNIFDGASNKEELMFALCGYKCTFCGRAIEHSFVTLGENHYHAVENEYGHTGPLSCWDQSEHGTKSLTGPPMFG